MANTKSSAKLFQILKEQNFSTMGFERRLGLDRTESEQFHSILRGKKEITEDLAKRINELLPQYSVEWLLDGNTKQDPNTDIF